MSRRKLPIGYQSDTSLPVSGLRREGEMEGKGDDERAARENEKRSSVWVMSASERSSRRECR